MSEERKAEWVATHALGVMNISATYDHRQGPAFPQAVNLSAYFETAAEAEAFAAGFPKSAKLRVSTLSFGGGAQLATVNGHIRLTADGVNGGVNETGLRRLSSVLRKLENFEWATTCANAYGSLDELRTAVSDHG